LLLDEPTVGLDPEERARLLSILAQLAMERTVMLSTHILGDTEALCTDVVVIGAGRVRFTGTPAQLARLASGHVWELVTDREQLTGRQGAWNVVGSRFSGGRLVCRLLADVRPDDSASPAEATLEDGYLWLTRGGVNGE